MYHYFNIVEKVCLRRFVFQPSAFLIAKIELSSEILDFGWKFKKKLAEGITNQQIDEIYESAKSNGALGGKISGAGGGGFFFFYCPNNTRYKVISDLQQFGGRVRKYHFTSEGLTTWNTKNLK